MKDTIYVNRDLSTERSSMDKHIALNRLMLRHHHQMHFLSFGLCIIGLGVLSFLVGYLFFDSMFMKVFSVSILFILGGIILTAIYDGDLKNTRKELKQLEE